MHHISFAQLLFAFIPVLFVIGIMYSWNIGVLRLGHALLRMVVQLLLIGFVLNYIFNSQKFGLVIVVLCIMLTVSSWIALRALPDVGGRLYQDILLSNGIGGVFTLLIITQGVLQIDPWYDPKVMIPIAGMIFANSMNSISLAGERYYSDLIHMDSLQARNTAFHAAMIPNINSLFAVGLVSLPGMMTGQILSGVSPFLAARYQIMVMCMILGSAGISTALFLYWRYKRTVDSPDYTHGT